MILVFSIIFSFASVQNVFAQKTKDINFKEIDELIENSEHDKALRELSRFIKKHPEALDDAQKRIDKIIRIRELYSQLITELLDVIEKEPENDEKKLAIIKQIESVEKNPSEKQKAFIRNIKLAAEASVYIAMYRKIMRESGASTSNGDYEKAISIVRGGFDIYRENFYQDYPPSITDEVTRQVEDVERILRDYSAAHAAYKSAYDAFIKAIRSGNYENALNAFGTFQTQIANFSVLRNSIVQKGKFFDDLFAKLKEENPDLPETSYLPFMSHFMFGAASVENSGILNAMDVDITAMTENSKREIGLIINSKTSTFVEKVKLEDALKNGSLQNVANLNDADNFVSLALKVNSLYSMLNDKDGNSVGDLCPLYTRSMDFVHNVLANTNPSFQNYSEFKKANTDFAALTMPQNPFEDIKSDSAYKGKMRDLTLRFEKTRKTAYDNLNAQWFVDYKNDLASQNQEDTPQEKKGGIASQKQEAAQERKSAQEKKGAQEKSGGIAARENSVIDWEKQSGFYENLNNLAYEQSVAVEKSAWKDLSAYYASAVTGIKEKHEGDFATITSLFAEHYSKEALQNAESLQSAAAYDLELLSQMQSDMETAPQEEIAEVRAEVEKTIVLINGYNEQSGAIIEDAKKEIELAKTANEKADAAYDAAVAELDKEDYPAAVKSIRRARELYNESLSHQESAELRETSDKNLAELGKKIAEGQNKIIVMEVRQLKTRAREAYYAGNFESAENLLTIAEEKWNETNVDEDEEIKSLKLIVQNALEMKTGREIKPTAPLYPEMSQILNTANQYYDKGEKLMKDGKRSEAEDMLNTAKIKLKELQDVYPLNQKASILTLRIENLIDPEAFRENFKNRVEGAKKNVKAAANRQTYSELLDLQELDPEYPGLADLIYDIEIELGIRVKPVAMEDVYYAESLMQEAEALFNNAGGNQENMRQAVALLDRAISANSQNSNASELKDRIQINMGGTASVVLSAADEASYNRAIQALRNNDINGAKRIVGELMANPENRRSPKLIKLEKQIGVR